MVEADRQKCGTIQGVKQMNERVQEELIRMQEYYRWENGVKNRNGWEKARRRLETAGET